MRRGSVISYLWMVGACVAVAGCYKSDPTSSVQKLSGTLSEPTAFSPPDNPSMAERTFELLHHMKSGALDRAMLRLQEIEAPQIHEQLIEYGIVSPIPSAKMYPYGDVDVRIIPAGLGIELRVRVELPEHSSHTDEIVQRVRSEADQTVTFLRAYFTGDNVCELYDPAMKVGRCREDPFAQIFFPTFEDLGAYADIARDVTDIYNSFRIEAAGTIGRYPDQVIVDCFGGLPAAETTCKVTPTAAPMAQAAKAQR
jgi:hypothetical protein